MLEKICSHCGATVLVGLEFCPNCLSSVRIGDAQTPQNATEVASDAGGVAGVTSMSEGYTRVVCPKCLHPHRTRLDTSPSTRLMCTACQHQFPASMAAEFRQGADLHCHRCGVTTFCVNGLRVNRCPNCRSRVQDSKEPERTKLLLVARVAALLVVAGLACAIVTQTTPQFLLWLTIGVAFTLIGFVPWSRSDSKPLSARANLVGRG